MLNSAIGHSTQGRLVTHQLPGTDQLLRLKSQPKGPRQSIRPFTGSSFEVSVVIETLLKTRSIYREFFALFHNCFSSAHHWQRGSLETYTNTIVIVDAFRCCHRPTGLCVAMQEGSSPLCTWRLAMVLCWPFHLWTPASHVGAT